MRVTICFIVICLATSASAETLNIKIQELRSDKGTIEFLVFKKDEGYPDHPEKSIRQGSITPDEAKQGFLLTNLPAGEVAVTFIHDENGNKKLDKKALGLPDEGVGFSNNPRIFFGAPSFNRAKVKLTGDESIKVRMKYF